MSELERFMRDVDADADLAKRFGTVANRIALNDDTLSEAEVKSRAMSELGYKVTATQLEIVEQVAGGMPKGVKPPKCTGRYARGEIPFCWGTNNGCEVIFN